MQVKTISATVRKALEMQGGWYTVELAAEATLTKAESKDWEEHQADLVMYLREDVSLAMVSKRPNRDARVMEEVPEKSAESQPAQEAPEHGENGLAPVPAESRA